MLEIDARGLECPAPVMKTRAAIETGGVTTLTVLVDNGAAQQNVQRFLESRGFRVVLTSGSDALIVTGHAPAGLESTAAVAPAPAPAAHDGVSATPHIMVFCTSDCIGSGDDELGHKLMLNFIRTLSELGAELWRLVFVNSGVKLCIEGSPVLSELLNYEKEGVSILVCGTCLEHFKLLDQKKVGQTTNMLDIVTSLQLATKVISL